MTELDIERERREFEAAYPDRFYDRDTSSPECYASAGMQYMWEGWLAAKRAVLGSAEPVAVIRFDRATPGKENEMPRVVSCNWLPDGDHAVYAAPPAPVSAEPDWSSSKTLESSCWKNPLYPMGERLEMADGAVRFRDDIIKNLRQQLASAQPQVDEMDVEIERAAQAIYEGWQSKNGYVAWVPNGNSLKQDEARAFARQAIAAKGAGK